MPRQKGQKSSYTLSDKALHQRQNAKKTLKDLISASVNKQEDFGEEDEEDVIYIGEDSGDSGDNEPKEPVKEPVKEPKINEINDLQEKLKLLLEDFENRQKVKQEREKSKPEKLKKSEERKQRIEEKTKILQALKEDYEERVARRQTINRLIDNKKASLASFCKF